MTSDDERLRQWIGRSETAHDRLGLERARALQATLDLGAPPLQEGEPLPPLWHWLYFWAIAPRSQLGRDGHPALGRFLPPVGTARRMWAGSRVAFPGQLGLGEAAQRTSTILDVTVKTGRTGRLVFVTVRHEIAGAAGLAIVDEHDIVYREDADRQTGAGASGRAGEAAPADAAFAQVMVADPTLLFRYSALTFNGHRIHYDRDYATGTEGYAGLVVHGPLLATLMVDLAVRSWPERSLARFAFRGLRPVLDAQPFTVCARPGSGPRPAASDDQATLDLWVADTEGLMAMTGSAGFR